MLYEVITGRLPIFKGIELTRDDLLRRDVISRLICHFTLSIPDVEAARVLVDEREVAILGVDTASIDYGRSDDFPVHRIVV